MKRPIYFILEADFSHTLIGEVQIFLDAGWALQGGTTFSGVGYTRKYIQTIIWTSFNDPVYPHE